MQSHFFQINGQTIHAKIDGPEGAPVMLMLHGFPEYWAAWAQVAKHFTDSYRVVLPDQRGFNLSSKPTDRKEYDTKHLVADMAALADELSPNRQIVLCGHDWGASVAYAFAMRHAERVSKFIVANGVHPICFQKSLLAAGPQTDGSQYMNTLRAEGMEERLRADKYAKLLSMFAKFSAAPWLSETKKDEYRTAWDQPGALSAMLNWYRGSPMIVPESGSAPQDLPINGDMLEKYHISMPHLVLWGLDDIALLPEARADLPAFCKDLIIEEIPDASHWVLHEQPALIAQRMSAFLGR